MISIETANRSGISAPTELARAFAIEVLGAEGVVDLSRLAGRGVFRCWDAADAFEAVRVAEHGAVVWGDDAELCPDALYLQVTGKAVDEVMPGTVPLLRDA